MRIDVGWGGGLLTRARGLIHCESQKIIFRVILYDLKGVGTIQDTSKISKKY